MLVCVGVSSTAWREKSRRRRGGWDVNVRSRLSSILNISEQNSDYAMLGGIYATSRFVYLCIYVLYV